MKLGVNIKIVIFCLISFVVLLSNEDGRSVGNTGAPGEMDDNVTCKNCHIRGNYDPIADVSILGANGLEVTTLQPNTQYTINMKVGDTKGLARSYGFQLVPLRNTNNTFTGTWGTLGARVKRVTTLGRQYLTHTQPNTTTLFTAKWTSPNIVGENITFYYAMAATDNQGTALGDNSLTGQETFPIGTSTSSEDVEKFEVSVYPSVVREILYLNSAETLKDISFFDTKGSMVLKTAADEQGINLSQLSNGIYVLKIQNSKGQFVSRKIIKQ